MKERMNIVVMVRVPVVMKKWFVVMRRGKPAVRHCCAGSYCFYV